MLAGEPLTFFLDDILVNFDDSRAEATLRALGAVAERTQVLFFTHHSKLVELATSVLGTEMMAVHDLSAA